MRMAGVASDLCSVPHPTRCIAGIHFLLYLVYFVTVVVSLLLWTILIAVTQLYAVVAG